MNSEAYLEKKFFPFMRKTRTLRANESMSMKMFQYVVPQCIKTAMQ